ncbi:MAG: peptidylprolyl isomerase [Verrucomicrobiales bacterium]
MNLLRNCIVLIVLLSACAANAVIYLQVKTTLGNMTLELYDQEKPITVNNFMRYVREGRWTNQFVQRWETNFVIQAGGWTVNKSNSQLNRVDTYGVIQNEYTADPKFSNKYGTIAMARSSEVNSATSQWFFNLSDENTFLDGVNGGFTVFGKIIHGYDVLNLFKAPKGTQTPPLYTVNFGDAALTTVPTLKPSQVGVNDLIFVDFVEAPRPVISLSFIRNSRQISFESIPGIQYVVETASEFPLNWKSVGAVTGTGGRVSITDSSARTGAQFYRVRF